MMLMMVSTDCENHKFTTRHVKRSEQTKTLKLLYRRYTEYFHYPVATVVLREQFIVAGDYTFVQLRFIVRVYNNMQYV